MDVIGELCEVQGPLFLRIFTIRWQDRSVAIPCCVSPFLSRVPVNAVGAFKARFASLTYSVYVPTRICSLPPLFFLTSFTSQLAQQHAFRKYNQ